MLRQPLQAAGRLALASGGLSRLLPLLSCAPVAAAQPFAAAACGAAAPGGARRGLASDASEAWDSLRQSFSSIKVWLPQPCSSWERARLLGALLLAPPSSPLFSYPPTPCVQVEVGDDGVAMLTLDRPQVQRGVGCLSACLPVCLPASFWVQAGRRGWLLLLLVPHSTRHSLCPARPSMPSTLRWVAEYWSVS